MVREGSVNVEAWKLFLITVLYICHLVTDGDTLYIHTQYLDRSTLWYLPSLINKFYIFD